MRRTRREGGAGRTTTGPGGRHRRRRAGARRVGLRVGGAALALLLAGAAPLGAQTGARAVLDRAMELMGGEDRLRDVRTVRFDMRTQWQRTGFRGLPATDRPSFEDHVDVRDYTIPAWRNTRIFPRGNVINVIRDSVGTTDFGNGVQPQSVAYVDERRELFVYTPDRLLLALADAPDLRLGADTTLAGEPHRRLRATLAGRFDAEVFIQAASGAPTHLRFTAAHPNDYGLVPWGAMEVGVWYAGWRDFDGLAIPTQWDVERVGAPYKRMTVRDAAFGVELAPDSFAVSDEMRARFLAEATMPMHESRPLEPYEVGEDGVAQGGGFGFPPGAVRTSDGWVLVGVGQATSSLEEALPALEAAGAGPVAHVLAATASTGDGGVVAAARRGLPIWTSPSAEPFVRRMLEAGGVRGDVRVVGAPTVLGTGEERLLLVPFALPDAPGSLLAFHPESGWLWAPDAEDALGVRLALEAARSHGWAPVSLGTRRRFRTDVPGG